MEKEDNELTQECQQTIAMLEGLKEKLKDLSPTGIGLPLKKPKESNKSDKSNKQVQLTKSEK